MRNSEYWEAFPPEASSTIRGCLCSMHLYINKPFDFIVSDTLWRRIRISKHIILLKRSWIVLLLNRGEHFQLWRRFLLFLKSGVQTSRTLNSITKNLELISFYYNRRSLCNTGQNLPTWPLTSQALTVATQTIKLIFNKHGCVLCGKRIHHR